jgi:hypothetical protein
MLMMLTQWAKKYLLYTQKQNKYPSAVRRLIYYIFKHCHQNKGQNHNINAANKSLENVA